MEYVSKKELKPYKKTFNEAIYFIRSKLNYNFYFRLIGSAKRNLVFKHHNKGIDLDYQIIFHSSFMGQDYKEIKGEFIEAFNAFFTAKGYENAEDSMSAITVKKLENGTINHSYDITILSPEPDVLHIIRYKTSEKKSLILKPMKNTIKFRERYKKIVGSSMWKDLRDIYKQKRELNIGNEEKKSFSLLAEATNETLDKHGVDF